MCFYHVLSTMCLAPTGLYYPAKMSKSRSAAFRLRRQHLRVLTGLVLVSSTTAILASCASTLSELPPQAGGLPEGAPERPANTLPYPAVHDMPPPRSTAVLTEEEKKKVEAELAAMRDQQARRAGTKNSDPQ
jgi:hypothetical protein